MDTNFKRLMGDATRLTRTGDLDAATRAIREALGEGMPGPGGASSGPSSRRDAGTTWQRSEATGRADGAAFGDGAPRRDTSVIEGEWTRTGETASDPIAGGVSGEARGDTTDEGAAARTETTGRVIRARHEARTGALDYRLFVPTSPVGSPPPPLLVMLHGCTQDADDFARGTRMDALAAEHGLLVLYPEQSERANPQRCWNWFKHTHQRRGGGEAGLIEGCVRAVVDEHGVDPARVFVAGLSAGGAMAAILGSICPDLFAGVGVHSGLAAGAATNLPEALTAMRNGQGGAASSAGTGASLPPTIVFHGDADRTVHPGNGERVVEACLAAATNGTALGEPTVERGAAASGERGWTRRVHRDAAARVLAEHWLVHGAGHAWSGGDRRGSYADGNGPDASAEMVRFFLETSR